MAFRRDVAYLDDCVPPYVTLNGAEFRRVVRLIEAVLPDLVAARTGVRWEGDARDLYAARLGEAESLAHDLREAFAIAGPILEAYGQALATAKARLTEGDAAANLLAQLMGPITYYQTPTFRDSEPLAQWEDLRRITGILDRLVEHGIQDEINRIRPMAETHYRRAAYLYDAARDIERDARSDCLAGMRAAQRKLPDFLANSAMAETIIERAPGVAVEMDEAAAVDQEVRLPGQGVVPPFGVDSADLSDTHQNLRDRSGRIQIDGVSWDTTDFVRWYTPVVGDDESEKALKLAWIKAYGPVIEAAAYEYGIPAETLAGVVYMEAGGKPMWMDDAVDWARQHNLYPGNPDDTSYGPLAVQVDTAAVALGYDPGALTEKQREEIITSLKDPKQNIMITAKVLADAKDGTDFALTDEKAMTAGQGHQLAAIYNGGPDWQGEHAQTYADQYTEHVDEAGETLR